MRERVLCKAQGLLLLLKCRLSKTAPGVHEVVVLLHHVLRVMIFEVRPDHVLEIEP